MAVSAVHISTLLSDLSRKVEWHQVNLECPVHTHQRREVSFWGVGRAPEERGRGGAVGVATEGRGREEGSGCGPKGKREGGACVK